MTHRATGGFIGARGARLAPEASGVGLSFMPRANIERPSSGAVDLGLDALDGTSAPLPRPTQLLRSDGSVFYSAAFFSVAALSVTAGAAALFALGFFRLTFADVDGCWSLSHELNSDDSGASGLTSPV